jgi:hypothetical protein
MKILVAILLSILLLQKPEVRQIEFSKISRGYEEFVRINPDSVHVLTHDLRNDKPAMSYARKLADDEWTRIVEDVHRIALQEMETLPSPTMNRASDAAMHGTISITTSERTFTHGFDDENPNEVLKPLMKSIRDISGRKETK